MSEARTRETTANTLGYAARYELLDPLRGVAIIAVMLLHFCERGRESGDALIHARIWPVIQHGYLGVQLFFVISGYCITAALYGSMNKPHAFRYFMTRRIRRIFPPYWASMALVVVLGLVTIIVLKTPQTVVFPLTAFDWLCNVLLVQGPLSAKGANMVYWSLSIEIQFYVVMAVAVFFPKRTEAWLMVVTAAFLAVSHLAPRPLWGTVIVYWPEFLCGIAAYYWLTGRMQWNWTPAVLVGFVVLDAGWQSGQYDTLTQSNGRFIQPMKLIFCLGCMLVLLGSRRFDQVVCQRKSMRLLAWFGLVSYSLYLTHVPVASRLFNLTEQVFGLQGLKWLAPAAAAVGVCTVFGWLFFCCFEKPWLNTSQQKAGGGVLSVHEGVTT